MLSLVASQIQTLHFRAESLHLLDNLRDRIAFVMVEIAQEIAAR